MWPVKVNAGVAVFVGLHAGEQRAERDGQPQALLQALAVVVQQRVVRPGHRGAGGEQDQRVEQRQMPGIEGAANLMPSARRRRPDVAEQVAAQRTDATSAGNSAVLK